MQGLSCAIAHIDTEVIFDVQERHPMTKHGSAYNRCRKSMLSCWFREIACKVYILGQPAVRTRSLLQESALQTWPMASKQHSEYHKTLQ
jgi:hypothetical protein